MSLPTTPITLAERVHAVQENIALAARRAGRDPSEITLVAVTKGHPPQVIRKAAELGLRHFGENRVQEAEPKVLASRSWGIPGLTWHMVGHLQTNKVKAALELFDIIHSVDTLRLAEHIDRRAGDRRIPVLLQVNMERQPRRVGFLPQELTALVPKVLALPHLKVQGLMTIAPLGLSPDETRLVFRELRQIRDALAREYPEADWHQLSMGMTDDYPLAIEEGATMVRIGRAIFGERTELW